MSNNNYSPVPTQLENGQAPIELTEEETLQLRKSSRWVICLCFIQLILALVNLLCGGLIMMIVSALFISFGIVGVAKQRPRLLILHFIYSLVLYILSLIGFVLLILYCDKGCQWWLYVIGFFGVLFQAIGMRHSRTLICLLKKKQGNFCFFQRCKTRVCSNNKVEMEEKATQNSDVPVNAAMPPNMFPMYPIPAHHMIPMEVQPRMPQFFPLQPVQYPMMQHPVALTPMGFQPQQQQGVNLFPVMYKQI